MSRESSVFLLGMLVFLTPFLGVPNDWKEKVFIVSGAFLMVLGYSLRRTAFLHSIDGGNGERKTDTFVESHRVRENPMETKSDAAPEEVSVTE